MIDTNNAIISSTPAVRQRVEDPPTVSGVAAFSSILKSTINTGSDELDNIFEAAAQRYDLPVDLLKAVGRVESDFRPHLVSRSGAQGIMQLMPNTAKYLGVSDVFDPEQNIMGGAKYLREQINRFNGDVSLALAAYNAGWPAVKEHGGIPPFQETQNYVPKVFSFYNGPATLPVNTFGGSTFGGSLPAVPTTSSLLNRTITNSLPNTAAAPAGTPVAATPGVQTKPSENAGPGASEQSPFEVAENETPVHVPVAAEQGSGTAEENVEAPINSMNLTSFLKQIIFTKIIDMQMKSSEDDDSTF